MNNKTLAQAKEQYFVTDDSQAIKFFRTRTVSGKNKNLIDNNSWITPDIRIYNQERRQNQYKTAYLVTKKIDYNSRFALVTPKKSRMEKIRERLKYERVKKVQVQDYKPKEHSFYEFVMKV